MEALRVVVSWAGFGVGRDRSDSASRLAAEVNHVSTSTLAESRNLSSGKSRIGNCLVGNCHLADIEL